jgi:hypothetical protein
VAARGGGHGGESKSGGGGGGPFDEGPSVPRLYPQGTIVCVGGGPSLTAADVEFCRDRAAVVAINDAYRLAPWAAVLYAADAKWWKHHEGAPSFAGLKYSLQRDAAQWPGVQVLQNTGEAGIELDPRGLKTGRNGGFQAVNVAVHLGAARIVLLGYDMGIHSGKTHWFGDHPDRIRSCSPYSVFIERFATCLEPLRALGIEIVNCSRRTSLECVPRVDLREVLG